MALTKIPTHMLFSGAASEDLSIDSNTLYIDSSENRVGIANNSPSVALDVTGALKVSTTIATGGASVTGSNSGAFGYSASTTGDHSFALGYDPTVSGDHSFSFGYQGTVSGNHSALISLDSTARTLSDASTLSIMGGEVGIGTLSPADRLHVALDSAITNAEVEVMRIEATSSGTPAVGFGSFIDFRGDRVNGGADSYGRLGFEADTMTSTTVDGAFVIQPSEDGTYTERFRVSSDGKVGIGSTSPSDELHLRSNNPAIRFDDTDGGYARVMGVSGNLYYQADEGNGESSSFHRWDVDGTDSVMRLNATGLGLGTNSPTDVLHISTSSDSVGRFESTDATAYIRINDTDDSLYVTTAGQKGSFGGNASVHKDNINIDLTNGNTSIGSTVTTNGKLAVHNTSSDTVSAALFLSQYNAAQDDRNTFSISCDGPNNLAIFNSSGTNSGGYAWNSGGTERMRMSAAGRLVIGHNASISNGVASKLQAYHVGNEGSLSLGRWGDNSSPSYITFMKSRNATLGSNTILNDGDKIGEIRWRAADGANFNAEAGAIYCAVDGTPGADDMPGELVFQTTLDGSDNATTKMVIKANGNIGMGTGDPQTLLELSAHNASGQNTLRFTDEDTGTVANQTIGKIEFYTKDGSGDGASVRSYILSAAQDASPSTYLAFATNAGGAGSGVDERMRIDKDGAVIINGTTTEVAGSCTWTIGSRNPVQCFNASAFVANMEFMTFRNQGTQIGSVTAPSGGSSTSFNTSSDYRLKENVTYSWDATTRLKQLKPCRFNWISDDTNTLEDGFLAHEVQSIIPNAITGTKDQMEDYVDDEGETQQRILPQNIDHSKLVPLLVKTIQELEERIKTLEDA